MYKINILNNYKHTHITLKNIKEQVRDVLNQLMKVLLWDGRTIVYQYGIYCSALQDVVILQGIHLLCVFNFTVFTKSSGVE